MKNTLLEKTKKMLATCAALGGLMSALAPAAFAAQTTINLSGDYAGQSFTASLSYDSDTLFSTLNPTTLIAGDYSPTSDLGLFTVTSNGNTVTSVLKAITVSQNTQSNGLPIYSSTLAFYSNAYQFVLTGVSSGSPFSWGSDLLPTEANPLPFSAPSINLSYYFTNQNYHVNSYSVSASPVPLPATIWMLGAGLIGLGGLARQRRA